MKKFLLLLALCSTSVLANPIDSKCPQFVTWGAPVINSEAKHEYICKSGYAVNYNDNNKLADYVVETIVGSKLASKTAARKDDFREDPEVTSQYRATLEDYKGAGLDRGHMAPAANFVYDAKLMSESFYLSNMMPQAPGNNRGIWKFLEERTREWAVKYGQVYVITGTIVDGNSKTMGKGVKVPSFVYKIIIEPKSNKVIAFKFPNEKLDPEKINDYSISINQLEKDSGINFSPSIPAQLQKLELAKGNTKDW